MVSLPSVYLMKPCLANFRRKISDIAEVSTRDCESYCFAILLMFYCELAIVFPENSFVCTHLVRICVVDLVQGNDRWEFLVRKSIDNPINRLVGPMLQRFLQGQSIKTASYYLRSTPITRELILESFNRRGLCGQVRWTVFALGEGPLTDGNMATLD